MTLAIGQKGVVDPCFGGPWSPLPRQTISQLGPTSSYEAATIRLLLGTANIVDAAGGVLVVQRTNMMVLGKARTRVRTENGVRQLIGRMGLDCGSLDVHLRKSLIHQNYFNKILLELIEFFCRARKGNHTLAFLHAYRLLERMAFVFPLLYAVRSASYPGAFSTLKEFFKGGVDSELALLRKFQNEALDASQREAPSDLDFSAIEPAVAHAAFAVVRRCVGDSDVLSDAFPVLTIKSGSLLSLLINIRNRYFHFSVSNEANISVDEIGDSDDFFEVINDSVLNWLAVVFLAVLAERVR